MCWKGVSPSLPPSECTARTELEVLGPESVREEERRLRTRGQVEEAMSQGPCVAGVHVMKGKGV